MTTHAAKAALSACPRPKSEPIRTRSDVVYLDTLDDDSEAQLQEPQHAFQARYKTK